MVGYLFTKAWNSVGVLYLHLEILLSFFFGCGATDNRATSPARPWSIDRQKGLLCSPLTKCLSSCQEIHLFLPRDTTHVLLGFRCAFIVGVIFFFFRVGAFKTFCAHDDVALSTNNHPADYFYWIDAIKNFFNFFYSLPGIFMTENCRVYSRLYVINMRA